ncbi:hypothetical protein BH23BAC3_BH23BAC3_31850 [soil metagenome]
MYEVGSLPNLLSLSLPENMMASSHQTAEQEVQDELFDILIKTCYDEKK